VSRATELAEREAASAELEEPDETPGLEPNEEEHEEAEHEESQPEPEPITEAQIKKIGTAIEREDDRHEKALRKILGDLWEGRETCPLCMQEGFVIPAQPGQFDPEQRVAVLSAMGDYGEPKLKPHPFLVRCTTCDGRGKLDTGSQNPGYEAESCDTCGGTGRYDKRQGTSNGNYGAPVQQQAAWTPPPPETSQNLDVWGRPWGHKDWGQNPAEVNAV
jgi:hypothetical protein